MKKLTLLVILAVIALVADGQPFYRRTEHKPIQKMTRRDVRKAQIGVDMYIRENGKVYRNSGVEWTVFRKPKDNATVKRRSPEELRKQSAKYQRDWQRWQDNTKRRNK